MTEPAASPPAQGAAAGATLIEVILVVGVLSLFVLGALAFYAAALKNEALARAAADIGAIRSAVREAGGGSDDTTLVWSDLAPHLPVLLRGPAAADGDATLDGANPWGGGYTYANVAGEAGAWTLTVGGMPPELVPFLLQRIARPGSTVSVISLDIPRNCCDGISGILSCTRTVSGTTCAQHLVGDPPGGLFVCTDTDRGADLHVRNCSTYHASRARRLRELNRTVILRFADPP